MIKWMDVDLKIAVKPIKLSEIENITMSQNMVNLITSLVSELSSEFSKIKHLLNDDFDMEILVTPLIFMEREASSIIEGSLTLFEDQNNDYINEIIDSTSWEDRNLYELYKKNLFTNKKQNIDFIWSKFSVLNLHNDLYNSLDANPNFKVSGFDLAKKIKRARPGQISNSDEIVNYNSHGFGKVNLYFMQPSLKEKYLDDLINTINSKINKNNHYYNELLISDIAKFHVLFEAIHPFSDGNGRIGRLLLSMLMQEWSPLKKLPPIINFSEYFNKDKEKYHSLLKNVQLNPKSEKAWYEWNNYFVDAMLFTKKIQIKRMWAITNIYLEAIKNPKIKNNKIRKKFLNNFFKYYKLNRKIEIDKVSRYKTLKALYDDFNFVTNFLGAKEIEKGTFDFVKLRKILREL